MLSLPYKEIILHDEKHHWFFLRKLSDKDLALRHLDRKKLYPDLHNGQ